MSMKNVINLLKNLFKKESIESTQNVFSNVEKIVNIVKEEEPVKEKVVIKEEPIKEEKTEVETPKKRGRKKKN
jgi:hypothetical protein